MIYYVEDDLNVRNLTIYALEHAGLEVKGFSTGSELDVACVQALPSLILLDIMLPGEDGISILKRLKKHVATRDIPVMMLTAKGSEFDVVSGLDSGAEDYLIKPYGMMELVSRVNALLRRGSREDSNIDSAANLEAGNGKSKLELSNSTHKVTVGGKPVTLTLKEFDLLMRLLQNIGRVLTREQLLEAVWGYETASGSRTVDVHIQTLRQKLGKAGSLIETVRGVGYRIVEATTEKDTKPSNQSQKHKGKS
jgi:two-component system alkaline phosphatase synthesis response regulator PhoP